MKKASEYLKHAEECRALARRMENGEQRDQLLKMAETWDQLAQQRAKTQPVEDERIAESPEHSA
jgi:hypothetical protein